MCVRCNKKTGIRQSKDYGDEGTFNMGDRRSTSTSAGGFVPYSSFIRKQPTMSTYTPSLWSRQENSADTSVPSWHTAHAVGDPRYTAFDINDRGNRIYLKYLEGNKKKDRAGGTRDL